ncbi:MAG TPA: hypothetical protein ENH28_03240 [Euryarchaeota archaeon]|nr:phenylalanyl-tRNA synthetase subunit beta [archaeon BMS3Bbin15]HDL15156.1 hypothetical protein [Euryarchaeota archaeon]
MHYHNNLDTELDIKVVEAEINGVKVQPPGDEFRRFRTEKFEEIRKKYDISTIKDHPVIRAYRDFYWRIGIDPTKIRPSSEALLRRVLKGRSIPEINNVVASYNLTSILTLISIGAYNRKKLKGEISMRRSMGENFTGIGGKRLVTRGEIVVSDEEKIINIFPYRDAEATKITDDTEDVLFIFSGVKGIEMSYLEKASEKTLEIVRRFCGE